MLKTWLKRFGKTLSKHYMTILLTAVMLSSFSAFIAAMFDAAFWKYVATTPEPELCTVCEDGNGVRYHAPALINLNTGMVWELEIYDNDPWRPWEIAEEQHWNDGTFRFLDGNATMSWSSVDHINMTHIGENIGKLDPAHSCHDCRALLAETANEGYVLLDLYDLENIQAFAVKEGADYTIRGYTVSIYKDKGNGGLSVEVTGHLFDAE